MSISEKHYRDPEFAFAAWCAYLQARSRKQPLPEWVLQYFDHAAERLVLLAEKGERNNQRKDVDTEVALAFGLTRVVKRRGERPPLFAIYENYDRFVLATKVGERMRLGDKETIAIEEVARATEVSASTVRRAWKPYRQMLGSKK